MGDWNLGSVGTRVFDRVTNMSWIALQYVNNYLRETTGSNAIGENRQSVVTNAAAMLTLGRMHNVGLDFNFNLGQFGITKGMSSPVSAQVQIFADMVNMELKMIPHGRALLAKVNG